MKTIRRFLFMSVFAGLFAINSGASAAPSQSTLIFTNPCNGDTVSVSATLHIAGNGAVVLSGATGVDLTTGATFVVTYQYSEGGPRAFVVNFHLVGGYSEHDLFLFDANGIVTKVTESSTCS